MTLKENISNVGNIQADIKHRHLQLKSIFLYFIIYKQFSHHKHACDTPEATY